MKKIILLTLLSLGLLFTTAQKYPSKIGLGFDLGLPVGEFKDGYKTGYGGYLKGLIGVSENGNITVTTGYTSYKIIPNIYYKSGSVKMIPVLAGYRHNFGGFYVEPQFGVTVYRLNFTGIGGTIVKANETGFNYCAGVGYAIKDFDFGIRFEGGSVDISNFSLIGFRVGYNFSLSKPTNK